MTGQTTTPKKQLEKSARLLSNRAEGIGTAIFSLRLPRECCCFCRIKPWLSNANAMLCSDPFQGVSSFARLRSISGCLILCHDGEQVGQVHARVTRRGCSQGSRQDDASQCSRGEASSSPKFVCHLASSYGLCVLLAPLCA